MEAKMEVQMEAKGITPIVLKSDYSRRYPDPLNTLTNDEPFNIEHFVLLCKAIDLPPNISDEPNPRKQDTDRALYKRVRLSLESPDEPTFHLKNKGITIIARKVEMSDDKRSATIYLGTGDGIADGGHTYKIIQEAKADGTCPGSQYVKVEVLTGIDKDTAVDITDGLNTALQVQLKSLLNLRSDFQWIEDELKGTPYANDIAYMENEDKDIDIRMIVAYLLMFNKKFFPNGNEHPIIAYTSKDQCLRKYVEDKKSFEMLRPILKDILLLSDHISLKCRERWNDSGGRAARMKGVYNKKERATFKYYFAGKEDFFKMYDGALYPILGSLRFMVEQKKGDTKYSWRLGTFKKVVEFFDSMADKILEATYNKSLDYGLKPNPIGKDTNHWDHLYKTVALKYLEAHQG